MTILLTGGSGRLGTELQKGLELSAPASSELDITDAMSVTASLNAHTPDLVVHAAAYTDVAKAETERETCWRVNVLGTRNVVAATRSAGITLLHISTDYVFYGDVGGYREDDPPGPVRNYYALSKLVAEEAVRAHTHHLVIRTSFRPREWPYPVAFDDIYTSQDYVDVLAPDLILAIKRFADIPFDTLHIAGERKSVYELAARRKPDVQRGSKAEANVDLPEDISLDSSRWQQLKRNWEKA